MVKSISLVVVFALVVGMGGTALAAETTITGHLRDSFCFVTMGAHGASHHDCAVACAKSGIPVMLEQDNTGAFFVLMPPKDKQSLPDGIAGKMEDEVTVTGHQYTKGGMTFLTVDSVK